MVHNYLWAGTKFNDFTVPRDKLQLGMTTQKKAQWKTQQDFDMYVTTAQAFQSTAVGELVKRETMKPQAEGGQAAQVGRKATGEMVQTLEKPHLKTGLRVPLK